VLQQGEQDVLYVPLGVSVVAYQLLAGLQHLLGLLGESVLSHHGEYLAFCCALPPPLRRLDTRVAGEAAA
jgi:hypothetical protein